MRFTALVVVFVFTTTSAGWAAPVGTTLTDVAAPVVSSIDQLAIPAEMGSIQKMFLGTRTSGLETTRNPNESPVTNPEFRHDRMVVLIQDAHAVIDAQENIAKILGHLQKKYGIRLAALEGAKGRLEPVLLRTFPEPIVKHKILTGYEQRAELSGPEMAAILQEEVGEYHGMEDWGLYAKNYFAYLRAQEKKEALLSRWNAFKRTLDTERAKVYDPKLNEFQEARENFLTERASLLDLLIYLSNFKNLLKTDSGYQELPGLIASIGYEKSGKQDALVPLVRKIADEFKMKYLRGLGVKTEMNFYNRYQAFLTGQITAGQMLQYLVQVGSEHGKVVKLTPDLKKLLGHAELLSEIKGSRLCDELQRFLSVVEASLLRTSAQREMAEKYQKLYLLKEMIELELTHEGLAEYQKEPDAYLSLITDSAFKQDLVPALEFYQAALARDHAFYKNIVSLMEKETPRTLNSVPRTVMVVAGGFHTNGLENVLKEKGIAYAVVTPKIASLAGSENYAKVMKGEVSFKDYLKTTYFDALMRHSAKALVEALPIPDRVRTLKTWRDNVIRELARGGRITEAGKYLPYIDEILQSMPEAATAISSKRPKEEILDIVRKELGGFKKDSLDRIWKTFESQLDIFTDGLKQLIAKKDLNTQSVSALLDRASQTKPSFIALQKALEFDEKPVFMNFLKLPVLSMPSRGVGEAAIAEAASKVFAPADVVRENLSQIAAGLIVNRLEHNPIQTAAALLDAASQKAEEHIATKEVRSDTRATAEAVRGVVDATAQVTGYSREQVAAGIEAEMARMATKAASTSVVPEISGIKSVIAEAGSLQNDGLAGKRTETSFAETQNQIPPGGMLSRTAPASVKTQIQSAAVKQAATVVLETPVELKAKTFKAAIDEILTMNPSFASWNTDFSRDRLVSKMRELYEHNGPSKDVLREYLLKIVNKIEQEMQSGNESAVVGISADISALYDLFVNRDNGTLRLLSALGDTAFAVNTKVNNEKKGKEKEVDVLVGKGKEVNTLVEAKFHTSFWSLISQVFGGNPEKMSHLEAIVNDMRLTGIRNILVFAENDSLLGSGNQEGGAAAKAVLAYLQRQKEIRGLDVTKKSFSLKMDLKDMPEFFFGDETFRKTLRNEINQWKKPEDREEAKKLLENEKWLEVKKEIKHWIDAIYKQMGVGEHFDVIIAVSNARPSDVAKLKQIAARVETRRSELRIGPRVGAMALAAGLIFSAAVSSADARKVSPAMAVGANVVTLASLPSEMRAVLVQGKSQQRTISQALVRENAMENAGKNATMEKISQDLREVIDEVYGELPASERIAMHNLAMYIIELESKFQATIQKDSRGRPLFIAMGVGQTEWTTAMDNFVNYLQYAPRTDSTYSRIREAERKAVARYLGLSSTADIAKLVKMSPRVGKNTLGKALAHIIVTSEKFDVFNVALKLHRIKADFVTGRKKAAGGEKNFSDFDKNLTTRAEFYKFYRGRNTPWNRLANADKEVAKHYWTTAAVSQARPVQVLTAKVPQQVFPKVEPPASKPADEGITPVDVKELSPAKPYTGTESFSGVTWEDVAVSLKTPETTKFVLGILGLFDLVLFAGFVLGKLNNIEARIQKIKKEGKGELLERGGRQSRSEVRSGIKDGKIIPYQEVETSIVQSAAAKPAEAIALKTPVVVPGTVSPIPKAKIIGLSEIGGTVIKTRSFDQIPESAGKAILAAAREDLKRPDSDYDGRAEVLISMIPGKDGGESIFVIAPGFSNGVGNMHQVLLQAAGLSDRKAELVRGSLYFYVEGAHKKLGKLNKVFFVPRTPPKVVLDNKQQLNELQQLAYFIRAAFFQAGEAQVGYTPEALNAMVVELPSARIIAQIEPTADGNVTLGQLAEAYRLSNTPARPETSAAKPATPETRRSELRGTTALQAKLVQDTRSLPLKEQEEKDFYENWEKSVRERRITDAEALIGVAKKIVAAREIVKEADFLQEMKKMQAELGVVLEKEGSYTVLWGEPHTSRRWAWSLVSKDLRAPDSMIYEDQMEKASGIRTCVIVDDASYSGTQISETIKKISKHNPGAKFIIAVPYMTNRAIQTIRSKRGLLESVSVEILPHKTIPTLSEILTGDERDLFKKNRELFGRVFINNKDYEVLQTAATLFEHKIADTWSVYQRIARFFEPVTPPYKNEKSAYYQEEEGSLAELKRGSERAEMRLGVLADGNPSEVTARASINPSGKEEFVDRGMEVLDKAYKLSDVLGTRVGEQQILLIGVGRGYAALELALKFPNVNIVAVNKEQGLWDDAKLEAGMRNKGYGTDTIREAKERIRLKILDIEDEAVRKTMLGDQMFDLVVFESRTQLFMQDKVKVMEDLFNKYLKMKGIYAFVIDGVFTSKDSSLSYWEPNACNIIRGAFERSAEERSEAITDEYQYLTYVKTSNRVEVPLTLVESKGVIDGLVGAKVPYFNSYYKRVYPWSWFTSFWNKKFVGAPQIIDITPKVETPTALVAKLNQEAEASIAKPAVAKPVGTVRSEMRGENGSAIFSEFEGPVMDLLRKAIRKNGNAKVADIASGADPQFMHGLTALAEKNGIPQEQIEVRNVDDLRGSLVIPEEASRKVLQFDFRDRDKRESYGLVENSQNLVTINNINNTAVDLAGIAARILSPDGMMLVTFAERDMTQDLGTPNDTSDIIERVEQILRDAATGDLAHAYEFARVTRPADYLKSNPRYDSWDQMIVVHKTQKPETPAIRSEVERAEVRTGMLNYEETKETLARILRNADATKGANDNVTQSAAGFEFLLGALHNKTMAGKALDSDDREQVSLIKDFIAQNAAFATKTSAVSFEIAKDADWSRVFEDNVRPIFVEVGVGNGEKSLGIAESLPDVNFIFIEPEEEAFQKLLKAAQKSGLKNVRVVQGEDGELFKLQKGAGFVNLIYCVAPYFNTQWPYFFSKGPNAPVFRRALDLLKNDGEILIVPDNTQAGEWYEHFDGKFPGAEIKPQGKPQGEFFPKLKSPLEAYHKKVLDFQYADPVVITKSGLSIDQSLQTAAKGPGISAESVSLGVKSEGKPSVAQTTKPVSVSTIPTRAEMRIDQDLLLSATGGDAKWIGELALKAGPDEVRRTLAAKGRSLLAERDGIFEIRMNDLIAKIQGLENGELEAPFLTQALPQFIMEIFGDFGMTNAMAAGIAAKAVTGKAVSMATLTGLKDANVEWDRAALAAMVREREILRASMARLPIDMRRSYSLMTCLDTGSKKDTGTEKILNMLKEFSWARLIPLFEKGKRGFFGRVWQGVAQVVTPVGFRGNDAQFAAAQAIRGSTDSVLCLWFQNLGVKLGTFALTAEVGNISTEELRDLAIEVARAAILIFMAQDKKTQQAIIAHPEQMLPLLRQYGILSCVKIGKNGQLFVDIEALTNYFVTRQFIESAA
ncbi:MAG: hypothetical protein WC331_02610 [Candidatus Omnitrophota bacterium]|jgi:tRNA G46 methylase TrmB